MAKQSLRVTSKEAVRGEIGEWGFWRSFDHFYRAICHQSNHERPSFTSHVHRSNYSQHNVVSK